MKTIFKSVLKFILKSLLFGSILLTLISLITNNYSLVYPVTNEATRNMIIRVLVLGVIGTIIFDYSKKKINLKNKKNK